PGRRRQCHSGCGADGPVATPLLRHAPSDSLRVDDCAAAPEQKAPVAHRPQRPAESERDLASRFLQVRQHVGILPCAPGTTVVPSLLTRERRIPSVRAVRTLPLLGLLFCRSLSPSLLCPCPRACL